MKFNEQTELMSKVKTDSYIEIKVMASRCLGIEGSSKKEKGLTNMDNTVVIARGSGV